MNLLVLFVLLATAWPAQAAALPSVAPARVPKEEETNSSNNLERENFLPPTSDVAKFMSESTTPNLVSDVAQHVAEELDDEDTGYSSPSITGYSEVSETGSKPGVLSRVKRGRAVRRYNRNSKRRYMMGGKYRPHGKYRG